MAIKLVLDDRDDRFPSMAGLLAALRYDPERTWRRVAVGAMIVTLGGLAIAGGVRREETCETVAPAWDDRARAVLSERGKPALETFERALRIYERALGPEHVEVGYLMQNIGQTHVTRGEYATGLEALDRALAIKERQLRPGHPSIAGTLRTRAQALVGLGRAEESVADVERALAMLDKSPERGDALVVLARPAPRGRRRAGARGAA